jgi:hypothetical protein
MSDEDKETGKQRTIYREREGKTAYYVIDWLGP